MNLQDLEQLLLERTGALRVVLLLAALALLIVFAYHS